MVETLVIVDNIWSGWTFPRSTGFIQLLKNLIFYVADRIWVVTIELHNVLHRFLHLQVSYMALWSLVKNSLYWSLVLHFFCLCIRCVSGNSPIWVQYTIMDCHGVTNTYNLWVLYLEPQKFQSVQLDYLHIQTTMLCGIVQLIGGGGVTRRSYLAWFLLVVEYGTTVSGCSWCQIYKEPTQNDNWMSIFPFYMLFSEEPVGIWNLCLWFWYLVPLVIHCPICVIFIGTLVW